MLTAGSCSGRTPKADPSQWPTLTLIAGQVRIAPVYTPSHLRGHGYASAVTAAVTQAALNIGADNVLLFTDLANPTSNALYQRLGYRPVADFMSCRFTTTQP